MRAFPKFGDERGQAAIFITMSLIVSLGMLGLVVDEGWAYWRKEACLTAAQAAASGAIMYVNAAVTGSIVCNTSGVMCQNPTACANGITSPPANDIQDACLWAAKNGFVAGGRQNVTIEAHTGTTAAAPGVSSTYYLTARVSEKVP